MAGQVHVAISEQPLDINKAHAFVSDPGHGAFNTFIGVVRDRNFGKDVEGVSYDVFESLTVKSLQDICKTVRNKHDNKINIFIEHFKGRLTVGGISVVIAVSTPHRAEGFEACRTLIEELKHHAPIWKQEHYTDGDSKWVRGHALCQSG